MIYNKCVLKLIRIISLIKENKYPLKMGLIKKYNLLLIIFKKSYK